MVLGGELNFFMFCSFLFRIETYKKLLVENGEAICCFGEAIVYLHYSVSSGPSFFRFEIVIGPGIGLGPGPELDNNYVTI